MQYNRMLRISTAGGRKATHWPKSEILWSEFVEKLKTPVRGVESLECYRAHYNKLIFHFSGKIKEVLA